MKSIVLFGINENIVKQLIVFGVFENLFNIVFNLEFLWEGNVLYDMLYFDKIVIGVQEKDYVLVVIVKFIYKYIDIFYVVISLVGVELIKYVSNFFLVVKILFINEMVCICEVYYLDILDIFCVIGLDLRIGGYFLQVGIGYGGFCFLKDLQVL